MVMHNFNYRQPKIHINSSRNSFYYKLTSFPVKVLYVLYPMSNSNNLLGENEIWVKVNHHISVRQAQLTSHHLFIP